MFVAMVMVEDDFAINLEKAIASVLKRDKPKSGDDEPVEEKKRGKKRKGKDKDKKVGLYIFF